MARESDLTVGSELSCFALMVQLLMYALSAAIHRSCLPTSFLLVYPYKTLTKTLAHHRERCRLVFQSIRCSHTYRPGLVHLKLVITLARESDLHGHSLILSKPVGVKQLPGPSLPKLMA